MHTLKILLFSLMLLSTQLFARSEPSPFARSVETTVGASVVWQYKNDAAVKSAQDNQDSTTYYHLIFDGRSLRLMLASGSMENPANAKHYEQFAVEDVQIDGNRVALFQWCLNHQERHARFLQQGLAVEKSICENLGENGIFTMMLNQETLDALEAGKTLSFTIKPFRSSVVINYSLLDFANMVATLTDKRAPAKSVVKAAVPAPVAKAPSSICIVKPPAGFETIKPIEYSCTSVVDEAEANKAMIALVSKQNKKAEDEKEARRQAEIAARKKVEDERLQIESNKAEEAAAIAASQLKQQELSAEITTKMLGVCTKMWAKGEHRCYCEKYIDQAPANIKALSCNK